MPKSIADYVTDWETLVSNIKSSATGMPGVEVYLDPMEQILGEAKDLAARLEMRKGVKQQETQTRRIIMQKGRRQASRVRAALKAYFGVDNERLVEFGARPVRPRTRKVPVEVPKTPPPIVEVGSSKEKDEAPQNPAAS